MIRPLDRIGSIKLKLGVLVAASVAVSSLLSVMGLLVGFWPRYTIPIAVVVALVVTQLLARGMTSPLREMTAAAGAMATGDYSRRVTATSRDEVGELARAFNTMAADLAAVDRQRRELVANVSHELRTPVSALRAVLENLADGVSDPDPATLRAALAQAERLSRLVEDLLDLSRVDAGITALDVEPVPLAGFLAQAVEEAQVSARPVEYVVEVEPVDLTVEADADRLHQLVANLVDNAARHSPDGGRITIRARRGVADDRPGVVLDVLDQGPGIAPEQREAVFERFTTGSAQAGPAAGPTPDGGTGLGLAISRWVTQLHGGVIEVVAAPEHARPAAPGSNPGCHIRVHLPDHPDRSLA